MTIWTPTPNDLVIQRDGGTGNMGSLAAGTDSDVNYAARFGLDIPWCLKWIRIHFSGSGTGTASCSLNIDVPGARAHDTRLYTVTGAGITAAAGDADMFFRVPMEDLLDWSFSSGERLVLLWTNPGNILWGATVAMLGVPRDQG